MVLNLNNHGNERHPTLMVTVVQMVYPDLVAPPCRTRGHGGADFFLVDSVIEAVKQGAPGLIKSGAAESLASHLLVFRAENSRRAQLTS